MSDPYRQRGLDDLYQRGVDDLADKMLELIYASDGQITVEELADFIETEKQREPANV